MGTKAQRRPWYEDRDTMTKRVMWRRSQLLRSCVYKLRNAKEHLESPEARKETWNGFAFRTARRNPPCPHFDFGLLASRTERMNFCCFKPRVCGNLLKESNIKVKKLSQTILRFCNTYIHKYKGFLFQNA